MNFIQKMIAGAGEMIARSIMKANRNVVKKHGEKATAQAKQKTAQANKDIGKLQLDEALKILNFETIESIDRAKVEERFKDYYTRNDPEVGGSEYIQAKVKNAYEFLKVKAPTDKK